MRTDHIAYQRATRIAGLGLIMQLAIGLTLLIYGSVSGASVFVVGSCYVLAGTLVWATLALVFHQHRLERIEAMEFEEIEAAVESGATIFEGEGADARVAARRLELMHRWLVPSASLLFAVILAVLAWRTLVWFDLQDDPNSDVRSFSTGGAAGWQLAVAAGLALASFIFSRFLAGMAKQAAWQNLRGGAAIMVGNALVTLAIAVGLVFRLLQKPEILEDIAYGICFFLLAAAAEVVLNLILNLYRPRRAGEIPRAAFDSRILSLLATPDSLVRSINEAINYQFGFDITSSWGYRLLLRSVAWLLGFGAIILVLLSMVVVIEPGRQAVILDKGRLRADVHREGMLFKLPWPFQQAEIHDVASIRELSLGGVARTPKAVNLWGEEGSSDPTRRPFIVAASAEVASMTSALETLDGGSAFFGGTSSLLGGTNPTVPATESDGGVANQFALVDADVVLRYRIKPDGLLDWLGFCNDSRTRRSTLDMRERALRDLAMREVTQHFSRQPLDRVLSPEGDSLVTELRRRIQRSYDEQSTGVEVVSISVPRLRPPGDQEAARFEELSIAAQNVRKIVEQARQTINSTMASLIGDAARADAIVAAIEDLRQIGRNEGTESTAYLERQVEVEQMLLDSRALTAAVISTARAKRWELHMEARRNAEEVLGEAPAYAIDPELYRQRALMAALAEALPMVRVKYILGADPERIRLDVSLQQPDSGLNLADTIGESFNP
ncbi:MAG: hypothetical protein ACO3YY_03040 [Phycisphaerales bacterium]|jgi:regulator of protease activity HflC (stomatin/prohibitin superfamily)